MLFAVVVATLVAILAGSLVFLAQLWWQTRVNRGDDEDLRRLLWAQGSLTPVEAARALTITVAAADRRLRRLVDDQKVRMEIDLVIGALRFSPVGAHPLAARSPVTPARGGLALVEPAPPKRRSQSTAR